MKTRPKDIGTAGETAIVKTAKALGFPDARRLALAGALDQGDLELTRDVIVEAKAGHAAEDASDNQIKKWLEDTDTETRNHETASIGFLVTKRKGHGPKNAANWWAHFHHRTWAQLIGYPLPQGAEEEAVIRTTLGSALALLRASGHGLPVEAPNDVVVDLDDVSDGTPDQDDPDDLW